MRLPLDHYNSRIRREHDFNELSRLALLLCFALLLTGGFLFAAWQHFTAIDYGYKTEQLRHETQRLAAEQKRLELARDQALSFANLEPAARGLGLQPIAPGQIMIKNDKPPNGALPPAPINPVPTLRR